MVYNKHIGLTIFLVTVNCLTFARAAENSTAPGGDAHSTLSSLSHTIADNYAEYATSLPVIHALEEVDFLPPPAPPGLTSDGIDYAGANASFNTAASESAASRIGDSLPIDFPSSVIAPVSCDCDCECDCVTNDCGCVQLPPCDCQYFTPQAWMDFDLLLWFPKGGRTAPLIARSPVGTPQASLGIRESSTTLYGGRIGNDLNAGARMRAGWWIDPDRQVGVQQEFFALSNGGDFTSFGGNDDILARPFFNTDPSVNRDDAQVFNLPGTADGTTTFRDLSQVFSSATALRWNLDSRQPRPSASQRTDMTLGYRFLRTDEEFSSREHLSPMGSQFIDGSFYQLDDEISTRNIFHGAEVGIDHIRRSGDWSWDVGTSIAIGQVQRSIDASGATRIVIPGFSDTTVPGGFLIGPQDIGRFADREVAVIPQARFNASRRISGNWRLRAGYSFLYLNSAFRPYSLANTTFDGARLANVSATSDAGGPSQPPNEGVWFHGVNVGLTREF